MSQPSEPAAASGGDQHLSIDEHRIGRSVVRLAWPLIAERVSFAALAIVDLVLVGRYVGDDGLAGVGIATLLIWFASVGVMGVEIGVTAVASWDFGGRRTERLAATVQNGVVLALIWAAGSAVVLTVGSGLYMSLMGLDGDAHREGRHYLQASALSIAGLGLFHTGAGAFRGIGNSRLPMYILLTINILNAGIAYLLMSGVVGLELGTVGSGIGTTVGALGGGLVMMGALIRGEGMLRWRPGLGRPFRATSGRVLHIGAPAALEEMVFMVAFIGYARIVSGLGDAAVAAHALSLRAIDVALMPAFGLGTAATALVGQAMGAGRIDVAERVAHTAARIGTGLMIAYAAALFVLAPHAAGLFTDDPEVIKHSAEALRVFAIAFPALGLHTSIAGSLRGAGDVFAVMVILLVTAFLVRLPVAFLGAQVLGWGLAGAWMGAAAEINLRALLTLLRFRGGRWKRNRV